MENLKHRLAAGGFVVMCAVLLAVSKPVSAFVTTTTQADPRPQGMEQYVTVPMAFEANEGQTDQSVRFVSRGSGYSLFLTPQEAVFVLASSRRITDIPGGGPGYPGNTRASVVRMSVIGADPGVRIDGRGPQVARSNYLKRGDQQHWFQARRYRKVHYSDVYPGIDLVYYGDQRQLEYDFIVEPGRTPESIALAFEGVESLRLDHAGNLVLGTGTGDLVQHKPVIYQEVAGVRRSVDGAYRLLAGGRVAFAVGTYDKSKPLVIDPTLAYGSYLGSSGADAAVSLATDSAGNVYVAGSTTSVDFPLAGPGQSFNAGARDAFIAKFSAHNNQLIYSTYVGGSGDDYAVGVAVDGDGNAYVTGTTTSYDFPVNEALQLNHSSGTAIEDAYLLKLNPAGDGLVFSTYLGGTASDWGSSVAVDETGNVYVAGVTCSNDFLNKLGAAGACDGYVTKLDPTGLAIVFSRYLGGDGYDMVYGLDVDEYGVVVAGLSSSTDFPDALPAGGQDAFAAKLTTSGSLVYGTRLGGTGDDEAFDVAVRFGNAFVVGSTAPSAGATASDFPTTPSAAQPVAGGGRDGFLVSLDITGAVKFSTFHGGSGADELREVALAHGLPYVVGFTTSTDLPTHLAAQETSGGGTDAMVGRYFPNGECVWSTYLGGAGEDFGFAIAAYGAGNIYVAGSTDSSNLPTLNAWQGSPAGGDDGFLVRFGVVGYASYRPSFDANNGADVLWRNARTGTNAVWKEGDAFKPHAIATVASQAWVVAGVGYFNADDWYADILWRNTSTGQNVIWLSGDSRQPRAVATVPDLAWKIVSVADFDGDQRSDILWRNSVTGANVIWRSGDSATPVPVTTVTDKSWKVAGVGDFNGDYEADIFWRHEVTGNNVIWRSGNSATTTRVVGVTNQDWRVAGVGDFLNDGKADILWRNQKTGANVIWRNGEYAAPQVVAAVPAEWQIAAVGDYTLDGRSDIFWRNSRTGRNVIWKSASAELPVAVSAVPDLSWKVAD